MQLAVQRTRDFDRKKYIFVDFWSSEWFPKPKHRDQCCTTARDREGFAYPKVMHIYIEIQKKIKSDYFCAKKTNLSSFFLNWSA